MEDAGVFCLKGDYKISKIFFEIEKTSCSVGYLHAMLCRREIGRLIHKNMRLQPYKK